MFCYDSVGCIIFVTLIHDSSKHIDPPWGGGTIPAPVSELMLALWQSKQQKVTYTEQNDVSWWL